MDKMDTPNTKAMQADLLSDHEELATAADMVTEFQVETDEDLENAVFVLGDLKTKYRGIENKRRAIIDPLQLALNTVNNTFSPVLDLLDTVEKTVKAKITCCVNARIDLQDHLLEEMASTDKPADKLAIQRRLTPLDTPKIGGLSIKETQKTEVEDEETLLAWILANEKYEYLTVNTKALKQDSKEGDPKIPGWKVTQKKSVAITPSKIKI